jgi:exonuclease III
VTILYSERIKKVVTSVDKISDRIIATHLQGNPRVCIITAYAPTETDTEAAKDSFYIDLREFILSLKKHTTIITTGDFNARISKDSHVTNARTVGPSCFHEETNDNDQRLIDLCEAANLRPAFSHFANRKSRLHTYADPKGNPYQLDHIIISQKWWKSIKSCRSYNTIAIGSDHKIVCAKFKASFRTAKQIPIERC